eukprot:scaffold39658_cov33-Cyclotella_meneghiniana.AAC.2
MPVDWHSSPKHDACLSTPVVAGEKRGDYPPVDCDCHVIHSEKTERGTRLPACDCLLILTVSRLPAYDCSHRREMRRLPACRLRLSRRLASPGHKCVWREENFPLPPFNTNNITSHKYRCPAILP